jgi:hypothetical protein
MMSVVGIRLERERVETTHRNRGFIRLVSL